MILGGVLSNWMALVVAATTSVVLTPILVHSLGAFYYGIWVLASALTDYYGMLDAGIRTTVQRFVGRSRGTEDDHALRQIFSTGLSLTLCVCAVIWVLSVAMGVMLPRFFHLDPGDAELLRDLLVLLGITVGVTLVARFLGAYLCGMQRFDLYNAAAIVVTIVRAVAIVAVLHAGYGLRGIAIVTCGLAALSVVAHWWLIRRVDASVTLDWRHATFARVRELLGFSVHIFANTVADQLRSYTDTVVIAKVLSVSLITPFSVAARIMDQYCAVVVGMVSPYLPAMSALVGQGRTRELGAVLLTTTRLCSSLSLFLASMLFVNGDELIRWWLGPALAGDVVAPLRILVVAYFVAVIQTPTWILLVAMARHRPLATWSLIEGVANVVLSIVWGARYGIVGVALGTAVPLILVRALVYPWYLGKATGIAPAGFYLRALRRPLVAGAGSIALWMVLRALGPGESLVAFAGSLLAQGAVFGLLAYGLVLNTEERSYVNGVVTGVLVRVGVRTVALARTEPRS